MVVRAAGGGVVMARIVRTFDIPRPKYMTREVLTGALIDTAGYIEEDFEGQPTADIWGRLDDRERNMFINYTN